MQQSMDVRYVEVKANAEMGGWGWGGILNSSYLYNANKRRKKLQLIMFVIDSSIKEKSIRILSAINISKLRLLKNIDKN